LNEGENVGRKLEMELEKVLKTIQAELPAKSMELADSIGLAREVLTDIKDAAIQEMVRLVGMKDYAKSQKMLELRREIDSLEERLGTYIDLLDIDMSEVAQEGLEADDEADAATKMPRDYSQYEVDSTVEHSLLENLTHVRPHGFVFMNDTLTTVKTWKEMLIALCLRLHEIDSTKLGQFPGMPHLNGKKNSYFSTTPEGMREPKPVTEGIFLETNQSANALRNLMVKVLKAYGYKVRDLKVYFKADYSTMNRS
jgi:hypothetical protein